VREYPDNHRRLLDGGNDLQVAATLRAVLDGNICCTANIQAVESWHLHAKEHWHA
jgi:hypothetical protein